LLIVADDHGWNDLGCYDHPVVRTPNLDRVAAEGVRFTRCFTTAPLCSPGRGAVMTARYPHVNGVTRLVQRQDAEAFSLDRRMWTIARGLADLGYETAAARKWHLSVAGPTAHGFRHAFEAPADYLESSEQFLASPREAPWFLYFCPTHTHRPFRSQPDFPYRGEQLAGAVPPVLKDNAAVRADYAKYLSETSQMDWEIGRLLAAIERSGKMDDTVVAYCTDHGPSMHRAKFSLYEWGLHSSLLLRGPGVSGVAAVDERLCSTIDLAPTLMGLAGGAAPSASQGVDLLSRPGAVRRYVHAEHHQQNELRAVRDERFKLIRNLTTHTPLVAPFVIRNWQGIGEDTLRIPYPLPRPPEELYDLIDDPLEERNLAADPNHAGTLARLRSELDRWWFERPG
jgi:arylsulfatase A-like enzyme